MTEKERKEKEQMELVESYYEMFPEQRREPDNRTNFQKFRDHTVSFLEDNKGVALITITSYAVARNSGKSHDDAIKVAADGMRYGKNLEDMYNWLIKNIRKL